MSPVQLRILVCAFTLLTTGSAYASGNGNGNQNGNGNGNAYGNGNWNGNGNGNGNAYGRSVPIPSSDVLFGLGLAALAWLGPKLKKG